MIAIQQMLTGKQFKNCSIAAAHDSENRVNPELHSLYSGFIFVFSHIGIVFLRFCWLTELIFRGWILFGELNSCSFFVFAFSIVISRGRQPDAPKDLECQL